MLKYRIRSGLIMGGMLIGATAFFPPLAGVAVLMALAALGLWEFYAMLDAAQIPNFKIVGTLGGLFLPFFAWLRVQSRATGMYFEWDVFALFVVTFIIFLRQFPQRHNPRPLETMAGTFMGLLYIPFMLTFFVKILMTWGAGPGRWLLFYMILVVKFTDIGAYFIGCAIGRHKCFPRISPGKTWEGCIGGVLTALAVSFAAYFFSGGVVGPFRFRVVDAAVLGLVLPVVGIVGDLVESMLKRASGAKDSGTMIAGMGGLLDVLDSLFLAAPILYFYAQIFMRTN